MVGYFAWQGSVAPQPLRAAVRYQQRLRHAPKPEACFTQAPCFDS